MSELALDLVRTLYAYSAWATTRILDTTAALAPEQFLLAAAGEGASVRDTLAHTLGGQALWLARWRGQSPTQLPVLASDIPSVAALRGRWDGVERDTQVFVASLDEARLAARIDYRTTGGEPKSYLLWQLMVHQVNHSTQHRSEAAALLTQFGYSPGPLDLSYYLDLQAAGPAA